MTAPEGILPFLHMTSKAVLVRQPLACSEAVKYLGMDVQRAPFLNKFGGYFSTIFWTVIFEPSVRFCAVVVAGFGNDWVLAVLLPGFGVAVSVLVLTIFNVATPVCYLDKRAEVCTAVPLHRG
jgi:hypothetical protein